MSKFWSVFKLEYSQVVRKKSFLVGIFLTPIIMAGFTLLPALLVTQAPSESEPLAIVDMSGEDIAAPFKCDLCGGEPRCVAACPKQAILYIPRHIIGQPQRISNVLKYAHMKEVEYWEDGEKKILRYTETEDKGTNDEA